MRIIIEFDTNMQPHVQVASSGSQPSAGALSTGSGTAMQAIDAGAAQYAATGQGQSSASEPLGSQQEGFSGGSGPGVQ